MELEGKGLDWKGKDGREGLGREGKYGKGQKWTGKGGNLWELRGMAGPGGSGKGRQVKGILLLRMCRFVTACSVIGWVSVQIEWCELDQLFWLSEICLELILPHHKISRS